MTSAPVSSRARRVLSGIRDAWLMIGLALLMLVCLELAYRAQASVRSAIRGDKGMGPVPSAYAQAPWYREYAREYDNTFRMRWKPYVYFRRVPFRGQLINVDSLGHRRTVPPPGRRPDTLRVFFFGGSTLWGTYLRDSTTIPSLAAQRLLAAAPPGTTVDVVNFGESGYVFTQEMLELEMQLRAGNIPDVVVFYDGINDVAAAAQYNEAGVPQNEFNRAREFDFGRAVYGSETGVGSDLRASRAIMGAIAQRFQLVQRLKEAVARPPASTRPVADLATDVARVYRHNVEVIEALSRVYGFRVLYVWQTNLGTTAKTPTRFEQVMLDEQKADPFRQRLADMHRLVAPALDTAMRRMVGTRFVDQRSIFAGDTSSVFVDHIGHNAERAMPAIVDGFYPVLAALTDSARVAHRAATRARR